jgi:membrane protease YdiL (CAAX protease family)
MDTMALIEPVEIVQRLIVVVLAAIVTSWTWLLWRLLTGQPVLPEQPLVDRRPPPWHFGTVLLVFLTYVFVTLFISINYPLVAGLLPTVPPAPAVEPQAIKGDGLEAKNVAVPADSRGKQNLPAAVAAKADQHPPVSTAEIGAKAVPRGGKHLGANAAEKQIPWSHLMLLNGLVMVVLLIVVPWLVRLTSGATLADLGLSFVDWWVQVVCGVVATLIAAPPIYAVQFAAAKFWEPGEPEKHPLIKMIEQEFSMGVAWLAIVTAVMLAPMFEELVFRGLLQSWLVVVVNRFSHPWRTRLEHKPVLQVLAGIESMADGSLNDPEWVPLMPAPVSQNPGPIPRLDRRWIAIALASLLFAYVHAPQWPAPIALFLLAMVIGTVYDRTGSLIAAVCMHATFNGISTLMLFATVLLGHKLEPDQVTEQTAIERRISDEIGTPQPTVVSGRDGRL